MDKGRSYDEICYPFMEEQGMFCDYEILTDGLSSYLGLVLSIAKERKYPEGLLGIFQWLTEMALHLNGSLRGKLAVEKEDLEKLHKIYDYYKSLKEVKNFTIPTGSYLSAQVNICRYKTKEVVRLLNKINKEEKDLPAILFSFTNLMANLLFILSIYINDLDKEENQVFRSKSY